jgi:2,5-dioxopentanoate dehydrogenase
MALTFNSVDPRTGEPGPSYEEATPADVRAAVAAAAEVHRSGALRDRDRRATLLRGAAGRLRAAGDEIVARCETETGLPEARLRSELERTAGQLEAFAEIVDAGDDAEAIIDHPDPDAKPIPRPDVRRMRVPLGPVAVFGASNFPLAFSTAGGDTASALAAGCPVIVKGHPSHPGTGELVARELRAAVADAGLPEATFAHLPAAGIEVGEALVDAPEIAAVGFTGSYAAGRAIADRAAARPNPIPVYAEMGSVNPIVITQEALEARADAIAEGLTASVANFGGQLCTKPGVVFVPYGETGNAFADDCSTSACATRCARPSAGSRSARRSSAARATPTGRASVTSPAPTRPTPATSARRPSCSRSTSGPWCCSCATTRRRSCWAHWSASRASSPGRCTRSRARTSRRS